MPGPGDDEIYTDEGGDTVTGGIGSDLIYTFGGNDDIGAVTGAAQGDGAA